MAIEGEPAVMPNGEEWRSSAVWTKNEQTAQMHLGGHWAIVVTTAVQYLALKTASVIGLWAAVTRPIGGWTLETARSVPQCASRHT